MVGSRGWRLVTTGAVVTEAFYFLTDVQNGPASLASFLSMPARPTRVMHSAPRRLLPPFA
jgi:hypothetical protein